MLARNLCLCALIGAAAALSCYGPTPPPADKTWIGHAQSWTDPYNSTELVDEDCQAWQKVFNSMNGDQWEYGAGCTATDPCSCRWRISTSGGVYCTKIAGRVRIRELMLSQVSKAGCITGGCRLDDAIGDLSMLTYLDMPQNYVRGTIPKSLQRLRLVQYLNLGYNNFYGEAPDLTYSQYQRRCLLGGDNPKSKAWDGGFDTLTMGNSFGCPLTNAQIDCSTDSDFQKDEKWRARTMCSYCLPGNGCLDKDCGRDFKQFDHTVGNPKCQPCSPGNYSEGGDTSLYNGGGNYESWQPCKMCAEGHYQNDFGGAKCKQCEAGKYQDELGQSACKDCDCPAGMEAPEGTFDQCDKGGEGDNPTKNCVVCEAGKYGFGGAEPCQDCPCKAGFASRTTGAKTSKDCYCEGCGKGLYTEGDNMQCTNTTCFGGWQSNATEATHPNATCTPCSANHYSAGGAAQCANCDVFDRSCKWFLENENKHCTADPGSAKCVYPPTPAPTPAPTGDAGGGGGGKTLPGTNIGLAPGIGIGLGAALVLLFANEKRKQRNARRENKIPLLGSSAGDGPESGVSMGSGLYRPPQANPIAPATPAGATVLDTSNIQKYSVGQEVTNMGDGGAVSGKISAIIPAFGPDAKTGPGKIVVVG